MSFCIEFSMLWVLRLSDLVDFGVLRRGSRFFFLNYILKSVLSNKKGELCFNFLVGIFTKSLHRGGVDYLEWLYNIN